MATQQNTYNVAPIPVDGVLGIIPIGSVLMWTTPVVPAGYLFCDGSAVSRNLFSHLFDVIGTTYGAGDGLLTFNVPDMRGRTIRGVGTSPQGFNFVLAQLSGNDEITLTPNEIPDHAHTISDPQHDHPIIDPQHQHESTGLGSGYAAADGGNGNRATAGSIFTSLASTGITVDKASTGITTTDSLLVGGVQVVQTPTIIINTFLTLNFIIKI